MKMHIIEQKHANCFKFPDKIINLTLTSTFLGI